MNKSLYQLREEKFVDYTGFKDYVHLYFRKYRWARRFLGGKWQRCELEPGYFEWFSVKGNGFDHMPEMRAEEIYE